jgi:hypothetical protein
MSAKKSSDDRLRSIDRRTLLAGSGALASGVAGCSDDTSQAVSPARGNADRAPATDSSPTATGNAGGLTNPNVNGVRYPDPSDGLAGIDDALNAEPERDALVVLRGGAVYEGDTTITMDGLPTSEHPRNVTVLAHGATVNYTGSGRAVEHVKSAGFNQGQTRWIGGRIVGPGRGTKGAKGMVVVDSARSVLRPNQIDAIDMGIEVRNEEYFSEYTQIGGFRISHYGTGIKFSTPHTTDGEGTTSFRATRIEDIAVPSPGSKNPEDEDGSRYFLDMDPDTGLYASIIQRIQAVAPHPNDVILRCRGYWAKSKLTDIRVEQHGEGGTAIRFENLRTPPSQVTNISATGNVVGIDNRAGSQLGGIDTEGVIQCNGNPIRGVTEIAPRSVDVSTLDPASAQLRNASGDTLTAGPAWYDPATATWHSLIDDSTHEVGGGAYEVVERSLTVDGTLESPGNATVIDLSGDDTSNTGNPMLAGRTWFTWDGDALYLAAAVEEDRHAQPHTGGSTWRGDSIQVGVAPGSPGESTSFRQYTLALTENGAQLYGVTQKGDGPSGPVEAGSVAIVRDDDAGVTRYEAAIPWSDTAVSTDDRVFSLSFLVNDNDGNGRKGWVEWASGIGAGKDTTLFRPATLESGD